MLVGLSVDALDHIARQRTALCLQIFLQARLGVLQTRKRRQRGEARRKEHLDYRARRIKATVEEYRPADRLQSISKYGLAAKAAGFKLARAQVQGVAELERRRHFGERLAAHQARAQPAQVAFRRSGKSAV